MSQELLYTSAPQGLKPGSRGFCTVVSTQGMASTLAECLESLSGYRHAFPIHGPQAHLNPVNYSHLIVSIGGRRYHVLSRVANAGQDYTGRTNKLAHHVALDVSERVPGGPAWVLADEQFCVREWDGQVRLLPQGRSPRKDSPAAVPCRTWQQLTGDAGWAGVLAQWTLEGSSPIYIVFAPGTDTLALVVEALHLLPESKRWSVTFSTYFTKLPPGIACQWRFVLDGSPEAAQVRRDSRLKVLDLCRSLGSPPPGPLIQAARTGKLPAAAASSPARGSRPEAPRPGPPRPVPQLPEVEPLDGEVELLDQAEPSHVLTAEAQRPPSLPAGKPPSLQPAHRAPKAPPPPVEPSKKTALWLLLLAVGGMALLVGVGGTLAAVYWFSSQEPGRRAAADPVVVPPPPVAERNHTPPPAEPATARPNPARNPQEQNEGSPRRQEGTPPRPIPPKPRPKASPEPGSSSKGRTPPTPPPADPKPRKPAPADPLQQLREIQQQFHARFDHKFLLPLKLPKPRSSGPVEVGYPGHWAPVRLGGSAAPAKIALKLHSFAGEGLKFRLVRGPGTESGRPNWQVEAKLGAKPWTDMAKLWIDENGELFFHWHRSGTYGKFPFCILEISATAEKGAGEPIFCSLREPELLPRPKKNARRIFIPGEKLGPPNGKGKLVGVDLRLFVPGGEKAGVGVAIHSDEPPEVLTEDSKTSPEKLEESEQSEEPEESETPLEQEESTLSLQVLKGKSYASLTPSGGVYFYLIHGSDDEIVRLSPHNALLAVRAFARRGNGGIEVEFPRTHKGEWLAYYYSRELETHAGVVLRRRIPRKKADQNEVLERLKRLKKKLETRLQLQKPDPTKKRKAKQKKAKAQQKQNNTPQDTKALKRHLKLTQLRMRLIRQLIDRKLKLDLRCYWTWESTSEEVPALNGRAVLLGYLNDAETEMPRAAKPNNPPRGERQNTGGDDERS